MADSEITVPLVEGDGTEAEGLAIANTAGAFAAQVALRVNSAFVSTANPLPSASPAANTVVSTAATVGTSSVPLAAAGTMTRGWICQNTTLSGAGYVDLCWGTTATLGQGFYRLFPGSNQDSNGIIPPVGVAMSAIASAAGQTVVITVFN